MNTNPNKGGGDRQPFWLPIIALVCGVGLTVGLAVYAIEKGKEKKLAVRLAATQVDEAAKDPKLLHFALARGRAVYMANCASCHGADRNGIASRNTPDMTDDFWLYGGADIDTFQIHPSDIEQTILYGIHADNPKTRDFADMPPFSAAGRVGLPASEIEELKEEGRPVLSRDEIEDLTAFILKVAHQPTDEAAAARGKPLYFGEAGCWDCHTYDYLGDGSIGSANLTRPETWLYGRSQRNVFTTIAMGRNGVSPAFEGKLAPENIKAIAIYIIGGASKSTSQSKQIAHP